MKKYGFLSLSVLSVIMCMMVSCRGDEEPPEIMGEERMVSFLQEAYLIEGFFAVETGFHYDTLQPEMIGAYDTLLAHYGLSREDFESVLDWYVSHPKVYKRVHDTVVARLDRELADMNAE